MTSAGPGPPSGWAIEELVGRAADFHAREPAVDEPRSAWWCTVDEPALVLGSAQPERTIDAGACAAAGVFIARRRSGGGAVLMFPGEIVWLDVIVPRDDPLWDDDVARAMWWFGDVWAEALRSLGAIDVSVHRAATVVTPWSRIVCFDGIGGGEVLVDGVKAVGISQRRTRNWARLQSMVHLRWRPGEMVSLLAPPRPAVTDLQSVWSASSGATAIRAALESRLPS